MPLVAWRFQSDLKPGETDPPVTLFVGETVEATDGSGVPRVFYDTARPVMTTLSDLPSILSNPITDDMRGAAIAPLPAELQKEKQ